MKAAVFTLNTEAYANKEEGKTGNAVKNYLKENGHTVIAGTLPEDINIVKTVVTKLTDSKSVDLIITVGSTYALGEGVAPEIVEELCDVKVPGIAEALRFTVLDIDRSVILERGKAGLCNGVLIVNLADKEKAAVEGLGFVLPEIQKLAK